MEYPADAGKALERLRETFGFEDLADLARASGIHYSTLDGWVKNPRGKFTAKSRPHWRRLFGEGREPHHAREPAAPYAASAGPTLAEIHQDLVEVRDLLRGLLALDKEGRLGSTIKAKRKAGGAA